MPEKHHQYTVYRYNENNTERDLIRPAIMDEVWPEFMKHCAVSNKYWMDVQAVSPGTVLYICLDKTIVAQVKSIPVVWDGDPVSLPSDGWEWAISSGVEGAKAGAQANTLCALEIAVSPDQRRSGLSQLGLSLMRQTAIDYGFSCLIAPVRPSQKHLYPLIPMETYITWTRADGLLYDAWLRTHQRAGARILKVANESMTIEGSLSDWEEWTDLEFPGSGQHIVPGALSPVQVDREADRATYIEPNVWMLHTL